MENLEPKIINSIDLGKAIVSLLDKDIIEIKITEHALIEEEEIKKFQEAKRTLVGNLPHYILFITPKVGIITKEAREAAAAPEANVNALAKAVVFSNLGMRILANFFITVNRPVVPHKAFATKEEALKWLNKLIAL